MRWPRSIFFWALVILSLTTLGFGLWLWQTERRQVAVQSMPTSPQQSQAAPDFTLPTVTGDRVHLNDLRGKVILLNFWATWCPPCQAEMPDLNALYREFGPTQNFVVLGVDVEEGQSAVEAFVRRNGITFPLALDTNGSVSNDRYHVRSLPTSMIIDREGNIRDTWLGQISKNAMIARLKRVW